MGELIPAAAGVRPMKPNKENQMQASEIQARVIKILTPYVKDTAALAKANGPTHILEELKVNSARLASRRSVSTMSSVSPS